MHTIYLPTEHMHMDTHTRACTHKHTHTHMHTAHIRTYALPAPPTLTTCTHSHHTSLYNHSPHLLQRGHPGWSPQGQSHQQQPPPPPSSWSASSQTSGSSHPEMYTQTHRQTDRQPMHTNASTHAHTTHAHVHTHACVHTYEDRGSRNVQYVSVQAQLANVLLSPSHKACSAKITDGNRVTDRSSKG